MKTLKLFSTTILLLIGFASASMAAPKINKCQVSTQRDSQAETQLLKEVNAHRKNKGLKPLVRDSRLNTLAAHKAYEYSVNKQWAHDINGKTWLQIYKECSMPRYRTIGENLGLKFDDQAALVKAWSKSTSHQYNLELKQYTKIGIFVGNKDLDRYVVTTYLY